MKTARERAICIPWEGNGWRQEEDERVRVLSWEVQHEKRTTLLQEDRRERNQLAFLAPDPYLWGTSHLADKLQNGETWLAAQKLQQKENIHEHSCGDKNLKLRQESPIAANMQN